VVTKYLAMLHTIYGRDVNAPNLRGHTLLHLLARKGDDCADTIEALLAMHVVSEDGRTSQRLLRMDVLVSVAYNFFFFVTAKDTE
jgi:hypothetical protein